MKLKCVIKYKNVNFKWVSNHHDIHLEGICLVENEIHYFKTIIKYSQDDGLIDLDSTICEIYKLSKIEKLKWKLDKNLFEICVGKHYSYPEMIQGYKFHYRNPKWFYKLLFRVYYKFN